MSRDEEQELLERIRLRAYRLWEQEGRPEGRSDVHWDQASELVAIEDNQRLTTRPAPASESLGPTGEPVEPIQAVENLGEFPTLTDQGEERTFPSRQAARPAANAASKKSSAASKAPAKAALNGIHGARNKRGKESSARTDR
jgi:hypothetical protein